MSRETIEETQVVKRTVCKCDLCGELAGKRCQLCKRDICHKCRVENPEDWSSDYPGFYCDKCWEIGAPFREKIEALEKDAESQKEAWEQAAKKARQTVGANE